jgi:group I intron endonuclease
MVKPIRVRWDTGVYAIRNLVSGKVYVGSASKSFEDRWKQHRNQLIGHRHFNKHLQAAWDRYGGAVFRFIVLEMCPPNLCIEREQHWIDWYRAYDRRFGYNRRPKADSNIGVKFGPFSEERKAKQSAALKGHKVTAETIAKIVAKNKGKKYKKHSAEENARKSTRMKGHKISAETKAKIGAANAVALRGKPGHKWSEESKAKLSATKRYKNG